MHFSELYVSADGTAEIRADGRLLPFPDRLSDDAIGLAAALVARLDEPEFRLIHDDVAYRATRIDDEGGYWWSLRRQDSFVRDLRSIGLRQDVVRQIGAAARAPGGLILIAGKTASGKTSTAASVLKHWLEQVDEVAYTLESPAEVPVHGRVGKGRCFQVSVNENGFADAFGRAMRSTPRFILIGEIRYPEAARLALRAAVSGHVVVSTIHAGSIPQALMSLLQVGHFEDVSQAAALLADGLIGVIYQRMAWGARPHVEAQTLFGLSDGIRSKIRARQFGQLQDDILAQAAQATHASRR
jgi:twitching motility protein PilT